MNLMDAFLWVTALTYFFAVPLPKRFQRNWGFITQKFAWFTMGTIWVLCLMGTLTYTLFNLQIQWLILSITYIVASLMSYTGIQDWGSPGHNIAMFVWDLLLAIVCLSKI